MKKVICLFIATLSVFACGFSQSVRISYSRVSPQASYAARMLENALLKKGYSKKETKSDFEINLSINDTSLGSEAFSVSNNGKKITVIGGDDRGVIYGSLAVAEDIRNGIRLERIKPKKEKPNYSLRAIKFDLPWDTYRHSDALDLHLETCKDVNYWKAFLDMMAENRFNSLSLWNLHPYTFMIKPKNFPEASPFNDAEMKEWQALFSSIFKMAKERAIDTYIIPFNIFVSPEFSKAHNVNMDNLEHDFFVKGDTSEMVKRYTRECVTQMLQEYPEITGMGLTLGEGMAGMTPAATGRLDERNDY